MSGIKEMEEMRNRIQKAHFTIGDEKKRDLAQQFSIYKHTISDAYQQ
jgi:hypothetical protein